MFHDLYEVLFSLSVDVEFSHMMAMLTRTELLCGVIMFSCGTEKKSSLWTIDNSISFARRYALVHLQLHTKLAFVNTNLHYTGKCLTFIGFLSCYVCEIVNLLKIKMIR